MQQNLRFLIAASGSGGHLIPAIEIARALKIENPNVEIQFLGSGRPLEAKLIDSVGYRRHVVNLVGLKSRGIRGIFRFLWLLPRAIMDTWKIISDYRPNCIIGVGGYVAVLPVFLGFLRGIPTWIHEAELRPGLANYFLCFMANKVSLAFEHAQMPRMSNCVFTGHPLRPEISALANRPLRTSVAKRILIMGGSQGSKALDQAVLDLGAYFKSADLEIWHQARPENIMQLKEKMAQIGLQSQIDSYIDKLTDAYAWCDLIISRSGAGAVMELGLINIPCILVPYPFSQANHQRANALELVRRGKAILVEEGPQFAERLKSALNSLLDPSAYSRMRAQAYDQRGLDASSKIARGCIALCAEGGRK